MFWIPIVTTRSRTEATSAPVLRQPGRREAAGKGERGGDGRAAPEAEARAEEKQRQTRLHEGKQTEQARAGQDTDDYRDRPDSDSGADYRDDRAIHVSGQAAPTVVNTPVPQATQQPQQENNFIVFGATNTPAPQLTATPNIEITPTPPAGTGRDDIQDAAQKGDRGQDVVSMQQALISLGYLKGGRATATSARAPRRRLKTSRRRTGWTWTASRAQRRSKSSTRFPA